MRRVKKDNNHGPVVRYFQALGCSVLETLDTGIPGFPDLIVGCIGVTHLVEVKNLNTDYGRAGLNNNQSALQRDWRGSKIQIVTSEEDAITLVNQWRKRGA